MSEANETRDEMLEAQRYARATVATIPLSPKLDTLSDNSLTTTRAEWKGSR